jgi:hypothetical protein
MSLIEVSTIDDKEKINNNNSNSNDDDVKATFRMKGKLFWGLKQLALDKKTNMTILINEAVHDLLTKHQKKKGSNIK